MAGFSFSTGANPLIYNANLEARAVFALQMPPNLDCPFNFSQLRLRTV
jgi:hypothetical protein